MTPTHLGLPSGPMDYVNNQTPPPSGTPAYADVWDYTPWASRFNYGTNGNAGNAFYDQSQNPYQFTGGAQNYGEQGSSEGQGGKWVMTGGENAQTVWVPDEIKMTANDQMIPEKYRGLVTGMQGGGTAHEGYKYDMSKLPNGGMTKFKGKDGNYIDVMGTTSLGSDRKNGPNWDAIKGPSNKPINKDNVYWDDNYGWITPTTNLYEKESFMNSVGPAQIAVGALGMGFGAAAGPMWGLGSSIVNGARTIGDGGDWRSALMNMAPGIIGAGMGAGGFQMPQGLQDAMRYARYGKMGYDAYRHLKG